MRQIRSCREEVDDLSAAIRVDLKVYCVSTTHNWIEVDRNSDTTIWRDADGYVVEGECRD